MIFKPLKLAAVKHRIAQLVKKRERASYHVPVRSMKIIIDHQNLKALPDLKKIGSSLKVPDSGIEVVLCSEKPEAEVNFDGLKFTFKDINLFSGINNKELTQFASENVDLLITFAEKNNTAAHLLTAHCKAGIKVGRFPKNEALYDIILKSGNDAELFATELVKYYKQIINCK